MRSFLRQMRCCGVLLGSAAGLSAEPVVESAFSSRIALTATCTGTGNITQMAWGPDGRLYACRSLGGVLSFKYDSASGKLSDQQTVADLDATGIGFAADRGEMYLAGYSTKSLWRLTDTDGNGRWGEAGADTRVALVTNIPTGFHPTGNLQIAGHTLYLGIGIRSSDGGTGTWANDPEGESALNGAICWIQDLAQVPSTTDAARLLGTINAATIQTDATPYTSTAAGKLIVHSAGTRNPFGLAFDAAGQLFFTCNYNRADTHGDGTSSASGDHDAVSSDLTHSVHDQFFRAAAGADYGYRNDNWRGVRDPSVKAAMLDSAGAHHLVVNSLTPDALRSTDANYLKLHDPAAPVGLGPSSSADGFAFWNHPALPPELLGSAFVTRYNPLVTETAPGTRSLAYADLVAVDPQTGTVRRVAHGFTNPLAVLPDSHGHLLVADWGAGAVYTFTVPLDSDGDGVPDYWTTEHFGHPTGQAADQSRAADDPDGDASTNYQEYLAGTNPRDAASFLNILAVERAGADAVVSFRSFAGRRYRLESSDDLSSGSWKTVFDNLAGTGAMIQKTDSGAGSVGHRFYRLRALPIE